MKETIYTAIKNVYMVTPERNTDCIEKHCMRLAVSILYSRNYKPKKIFNILGLKNTNVTYAVIKYKQEVREVTLFRELDKKVLEQLNMTLREVL